jgi:hypothetical protein
MTTIALSSDQIRFNAPNAYTNNLIVSGAKNGASGLNIGFKLPISFTTNRNININGTTFSCYDIDLTKYVKSHRKKRRDHGPDAGRGSARAAVDARDADPARRLAVADQGAGFIAMWLPRFSHGSSGGPRAGHAFPLARASRI